MKLKDFFRPKADSFLRKLRGLIHVGANSGQERELYAKHGLKVIWIEPIPEIYARLVQNIALYAGQTAYQALISDTDGQSVNFNIASNQGASSSILPLKDHRKIWPNVEFTRTIRLESTTLATFVHNNNLTLSDYDGLVLDTQGAEMHVLRGGQELLRWFKFIKLEAPDFESYAGIARWPEIGKFLHTAGFEEYTRKEFAGAAGVGAYFDIVYQNAHYPE